MAQTKLIIETLKQELRKKSINYRQVADKLELSEASVKRLFSENAFTLERLGKVCELIDLEISDLVHQMEKSVELTQQLTLEQETELVADTKFLLVAYFLMHKLSFEEITEIYDVSETECIRYLAKLDRMKIIDLLPGNRVKLRIARDFTLIPGGPIERFYEQRVEQEFFNTSFNENGEFRIYVSGYLSHDANSEIIRKLKRMAKDANESIQISEELPKDERFGCTLIMAIRPWEPQVFEAFRRVPNVKQF